MNREVHTKTHCSHTSEIKDKEKILESSERETSYLQEGNNSNDSGFLIRNHGGQKEEAHVFQVLKKKELSTQNSIPSENILQERREDPPMKDRHLKNVTCRPTALKG